MNASSQSIYMAKKQLLDSDVELRMKSLPRINEFMRSLPRVPSLKLEDILVRTSNDDVKDEVEEDVMMTDTKLNSTAPDSSLPECIAGDWLYIGNHSHCKSRSTLQSLGITHILCCSQIIPTYFVRCELDITYARIPIADSLCANLFDHLYAAKQLVDACNPLLTESKSKSKRRVLVHCEVGMSRSASIVIAYLVASKVQLREEQMHRFRLIQQHLKSFERESRNHYKVKVPGADRVVFMKLNEAYYFVQSARAIIAPNLGFCKQLERWEKLLHGKRSTLQDLPKFTKTEKNDSKLGLTVAHLQAAHEACACALL